MERIGGFSKSIFLFLSSILVSGCTLDVSYWQMESNVELSEDLKAVVVIPFKTATLAADEEVSLRPIQKNAADFKISPSLPSGLQLDSESGEISGTLEAPLIQTTTYNLSYADLVGARHAVQFALGPTAIEDLEVGFYNGNACALIDGGVYCWAGNSYYRSIGSVGTFEKKSGLPKIQSFKIGRDAVCALSEDGEVYCWGYSTTGALGLGGVTSTVEPVKLEGDLVGKKVTQITLGYYNGCAVDDQKKIYCWGKNTNGQLGTGDVIDRLTPTESAFLSGSAVEVGTGENHTCALDDQGKAFCWGSNGNGQIGSGGGAGNALAPTAVLINGTTNPLADISQISVGRLSSCAISTSGLYCWGSNSYKMITTAATTAYTKAFLIDGSADISDVDIGSLHLCYLKSQEAYCAGRNVVGNLGAGDLSNTDGQFKVDTTLKFTKISVGGWVNPSYNNMSCGLTTEGRIACWGNNYKNNITPFEETKSLPASIAAAKDAVSISKDFANYDLCKAQNNQVYCAHYNDYARAGVNTTQSWLDSFVTIQGLPSDLSVEKVFTGPYANCALYRKAADDTTELWCWGYNGLGARGDGTTTGAEVATKANLSGVKSMGVGTHHSCALTEDSKVYCAGSNAYLQLGNSPSCVALSQSTQWCEAISDAKVLRVTAFRNCVITNQGDLKCWGVLLSGNSSDPVTYWSAADGETVTDVSIGGNTMCFVTSKGKVYCAGNYVESLKARTMPQIFEVAEAISASFELVDTVSDVQSLYVTGSGSYCVLSKSGVLSCRGIKRDLPFYNIQDNYISKLTVVPLSFAISKVEYIYSDSICVRNGDNDLVCWGTGRDQETLREENIKALYKVPEIIIGL